MTGAVTAGTLQRKVLDPALEAIALNRAQERIVYDPSPERDSIAEWVNAMADSDPESCAAIMGLLAQLVASNQLEQTEILRIAGFSDETIRHLRRLERTAAGATSQAWTRRRLIDRLRQPLAVIADPVPHDAMTFVQAVRVVDDLIVRVPLSDLLADAVLYQLGQAKAAKLRELVESRNESDARADHPDAASQEGDSPDGQPAV
jgi:hypothetical protein